MQHKLPDVRAPSQSFPAPPDNPVREWKRRACEKVLVLKAPPGRAPLCKATSKNKYSCFDPNCNYKDRTFRLDTYIRHLKTTHHFKIIILMLIILYQLEILTYQENHND